MDIAALSTAMSQVEVTQQASIKIAEMAMDTVEVSANNLLSLMEELPKAGSMDVLSNLGQNIDISV